MPSASRSIFAGRAASHCSSTARPPSTPRARRCSPRSQPSRVTMWSASARASRAGASGAPCGARDAVRLVARAVVAVPTGRKLSRTRPSELRPRDSVRTATRPRRSPPAPTNATARPERSDRVPYDNARGGRSWGPCPGPHRARVIAGAARQVIGTSVAARWSARRTRRSEPGGHETRVFRRSTLERDEGRRRASCAPSRDPRGDRWGRCRPFSVVSGGAHARGRKPAGDVRC
jgi:hypothetical protein